MKMRNNMEVFLNFLANNYALTKYIVAYTKRYNICNTPFYMFVSSKANKNPKGLFREVLGTNHKFGALEEKWIEFLDNSVYYTPQKGDVVVCSYFDEDKCCLKEWETTFKCGTKEHFIDMDDNTNHEQTFVMRKI